MRRQGGTSGFCKAFGRGRRRVEPDRRLAREAEPEMGRGTERGAAGVGTGACGVGQGEEDAGGFAGIVGAELAEGTSCFAAAAGWGGGVGDEGAEDVRDAAAGVAGTVAEPVRGFDAGAWWGSGVEREGAEASGGFGGIGGAEGAEGMATWTAAMSRSSGERMARRRSVASTVKRGLTRVSAAAAAQLAYARVGALVQERLRA
ncbi:hypothetical protein GCM10023205_63250 [Yinghuangia aomiensis]|uniref:Uncharacterized protein n=1 Tax=Yinghuangia aomiensis TaxID=676205 RepID=A0ABP9I1P8_9ACTN